LSGRPPRILHFANYGAPYAGSFIPMVAALARAVRGRGWSVELVFPASARGNDWLDALAAEGVRCHLLALGVEGGPSRWASAVANEATRNRWRSRAASWISALVAADSAPTILHTQFTLFDMPAAQAARTARQARVVWHEQSARPGGVVGEIGGALRYRVFARDVSEFLCVAPDIAEVVARQGAGDRARVLANAVDTERFTPASPAERAAARERLGVTPDASMLLHFGWHWDRKGGDLYLAAIASLLGGPAPVRLRAFTVGGEAARAAVAAANLGTHVTVLEPTERVTDLYAACDVFVSPSRAEGMPFALLEALSAGVPVVASDIPGQAVIARSASSCRISPLDARAIAATIREVLAVDGEARERQRAAARLWVLRCAGLDWWSGELLAAYDRVLAAIGPA
jgi:glycosyltransferase involved in cell wall biosynthesis